MVFSNRSLKVGRIRNNKEKQLEAHTKCYSPMKAVLEQLNKAYFVLCGIEKNKGMSDKGFTELEEELIGVLHICKRNNIIVFENKKYRNKMDAFFNIPENKKLSESFSRHLENYNIYMYAKKHENAAKSMHIVRELGEQLNNKKKQHFYNSTNPFVKKGVDKIIFNPMGTGIDNLIRGCLSFLKQLKLE